MYRRALQTEAVCSKLASAADWPSCNFDGHSLSVLYMTLVNPWLTACTSLCVILFGVLKVAHRSKSTASLVAHSCCVHGLAPDTLHVTGQNSDLFLKFGMSGYRTLQVRNCLGKMGSA